MIGNVGGKKCKTREVFYDYRNFVAYIVNDPVRTLGNIRCRCGYCSWFDQRN